MVLPRKLYEIVRFLPAEEELATVASELQRLYLAGEPDVSDWQVSVLTEIADHNFLLYLRLMGTAGVNNRLSNTSQMLLSYVYDCLRRAYETKGLFIPEVSDGTINRFNGTKQADILYIEIKAQFEQEAKDPDTIVGSALARLEPKEQAIAIKVLSALIWLVNHQLASELTPIIAIA